MTINDLFQTLDFSCYDEIIVHWPMMVDNGQEKDYHAISSKYAEPLQELFGDIHIMTMDETSNYDGGDASLFIHINQQDGVVIHIYLKREDVIHDNT